MDHRSPFDVKIHPARRNQIQFAPSCFKLPLQKMFIAQYYALMVGCIIDLKVLNIVT